MLGVDGYICAFLFVNIYMTSEFDKFCQNLTEKLELKIARGQNRKHMMQVPISARPKKFKKGYDPKSKTSDTVVNVAKKATTGLWKLTKHQVIDISQKYGFKVPSENEPIKQLGSTGITLLRKGPGHYLLAKRPKPKKR